jgi:hypothetical protein
VSSRVTVDHAFQPHDVALRPSIELLYLRERTGGLPPLIQQTDPGDLPLEEPPDLVVRRLRMRRREDELSRW